MLKNVFNVRMFLMTSKKNILFKIIVLFISINNKMFVRYKHIQDLAAHRQSLLNERNTLQQFFRQKILILLMFQYIIIQPGSNLGWNRSLVFPTTECILMKFLEKFGMSNPTSSPSPLKDI